MSVSEMRAVVMTRDHGCVAPRLDSEAGPCYDRWGNPAHHPMADLELDFVRLGAKGEHHELAGDHVSLCPGHHRGTGPQAGRVWATSHRYTLRQYLEGRR